MKKDGFFFLLSNQKPDIAGVRDDQCIKCPVIVYIQYKSLTALLVCRGIES